MFSSVADLLLARGDLGTRMSERDAVDDDTGRSGERPERITRKPAAQITDLHLLWRDRAVAGHGEHEVRGLIRQAPRHPAPTVPGRALRSTAVLGRSRRGQLEFFVGDDGAGVDRAARAIERVIDEVECARLESKSVASAREIPTVSGPPVLSWSPR